MAQTLDGTATAAALRRKLSADIRQFHTSHNRQPGLAVLVVGDRPDSALYVRLKTKACMEVGISVTLRKLPASATAAQCTSSIAHFNADPGVDGILVQLPLPDSLAADEAAICSTILPSKDVDCLHPSSFGALAMSSRPSGFVPCTAGGICTLLDAYNIPVSGKHVVVVGRSDIAGLPTALALLHRHATVTVCHSRTQGLTDLVARADIVVAAVGATPEFLRGPFKDDAVVVDVGIHYISDSAAPTGKRLVGDVHHPTAKEQAAFVTPVPGGVGPMTVATLCSNVLTAAQARAAACGTTKRCARAGFPSASTVRRGVVAASVFAATVATVRFIVNRIR